MVLPKMTGRACASLILATVVIAAGVFRGPVAVEPALKTLRGGVLPATSLPRMGTRQPRTPEVPAAPSPVARQLSNRTSVGRRPSNGTSVSRQLSDKKAACGSHPEEESCNANRDEGGSRCKWCTNHLEKNVCVSDDSMGYKFAPCNKWICYDKDDPEKSDLTACERVMV